MSTTRSASALPSAVFLAVCLFFLARTTEARQLIKIIESKDDTVEPHTRYNLDREFSLPLDSSASSRDSSPSSSSSSASMSKSSSPSSLPSSSTLWAADRAQDDLDSWRFGKGTQDDDDNDEVDDQGNARLAVDQEALRQLQRTLLAKLREEIDVLRTMRLLASKEMAGEASKRMRPSGFMGSRGKRFIPGLESLLLARYYQADAEKWKRQPALGFSGSRG